MKPFAYERATDAGGAVAAVAGRPEAAFLGGGTNLVDHMKLGDRRAPTCSSTSRRLPLDARRGTCRTAALRIGADGAQQPTWPPTRSCARATRCSPRRCSSGASGQLRNLATTGGNLLQRTRCVYFQDVTTPVQQARAGHAAARRSAGYVRYHAILGASEHCVAVAPVRHGGRAGRARRRRRGPGPRRRAPRRRSPTCTGCPATSPSATPSLEHGELITAVELPALPIGRALAPTARSATAPRTRSRWSRWPPALDVRRRRGRATCGSRFGGVAHKPWRARRAEDALRGGPATEDAFRARRRGRARGGPRRCATTRSRSPMARNALVATLRELRRRRRR